MSQERSLRDIGPDKSLLLVDDDEPFLRRLRARDGKARLRGRGRPVGRGRQGDRHGTPARLRGRGPAGWRTATALDVVEVLRAKRPDARIVVLTGYGAIATAVAAVKDRRDGLPVDSPPMPTTIFFFHSGPAGRGGGDAAAAREPPIPAPPPPPPPPRMSADRVRWEQYPAGLRGCCDRNVSETGAAAEHAPPDAAAYSRQAQPALRGRPKRRP